MVHRQCQVRGNPQHLRSVGFSLSLTAALLGREGRRRGTHGEGEGEGGVRGTRPVTPHSARLQNLERLSSGTESV